MPRFVRFTSEGKLNYFNLDAIEMIVQVKDNEYLVYTVGRNHFPLKLEEGISIKSITGELISLKDSDAEA